MSPTQNNSDVVLEDVSQIFLATRSRAESPFGGECNNSVTRSERAGIPSMRNPASNDITSASDVPCETDVCFLHIQLIGTNSQLPNMHSLPSEADVESSRSPAKAVS